MSRRHLYSPTLTTGDAKDGVDADLLESAEEILSNKDLRHVCGGGTMLWGY